MDRCQLATLVDWAGTLRTRKRLQKVIYLLRAAGCPFDADYTLHHYGPYSSDVARLADAMVQAGLLCEEAEPNVAVGQSFSYRLSDRAQEQLARRRTACGAVERPDVMDRFEPLARQLLQEPDLQKLEYAATIAYFRSLRPDEGWQAACEAAARFKNQSSESPAMRSAESLAQKVCCSRSQATHAHEGHS
ncbi:MAG: hypothetical protein JXB13_05145 [Phycisphaerae bacterium]|nr:hypothetical protein [Phycisphaerae bacterium]